MHRLRPKLTYSNVMATIAVFLALGGAGYAAVKLPKNSVGAKQLKRGAVTPAKLSAGSRSGLIGPRGPAGPTGAAGPAGVAGPSEAFSGSHKESISTKNHGFESPLTVATLGGLSPGSYAIQAKLNVAQGSAMTSLETCTLNAGDDSDASVVPLGNEAATDAGFATMALQTTHTFSVTGTVEINCSQEKPALPEEVSEIEITAIKVGTLTHKGL